MKKTNKTVAENPFHPSEGSSSQGWLQNPVCNS